MAGEWLKFEEATSDKPEVWRIAVALGIDADSVVGKLLRVWGWASRNCHANGVTHVTALSLLDRVAGVTGFAEAMVTVGWLMRNGEDLVFPHFERHISQPAKERALAAERQRKKRLNGHGAVTELSRHERDENVTIEKRREEKSNTPCTPPEGGGEEQLELKAKPALKARLSVTRETAIVPESELEEPLRVRLRLLAGLLHRRARTDWRVREIRAARDAGLHLLTAEEFAEDLAPLQRYYARWWGRPRESGNYTKGDFVALCNDWGGHVARVRSWLTEADRSGDPDGLGEAV